MSNTSIQLKKSGISGNTPVDLVPGEVAINYADGKLYYKSDIGGIEYITNQDSFATVSVNGSFLLATSPTDILTLAAGNNVTLIGNTTTKTITISATSTGSGGFPVVDLGFVYESVYSYDMLDLGGLI